VKTPIVFLLVNHSNRRPFAPKCQRLLEFHAT
jgi:hypothetical protein